MAQKGKKLIINEPATSNVFAGYGNDYVLTGDGEDPSIKNLLTPKPGQELVIRGTVTATVVHPTTGIVGVAISKFTALVTRRTSGSIEILWSEFVPLAAVAGVTFSFVVQSSLGAAPIAMTIGAPLSVNVSTYAIAMARGLYSPEVDHIPTLVTV